MLLVSVENGAGVNKMTNITYGEEERRGGAAAEVERRAARKRQALAVYIRQGRVEMCHGFGKLV